MLRHEQIDRRVNLRLPGFAALFPKSVRGGRGRALAIKKVIVNVISIQRTAGAGPAKTIPPPANANGGPFMIFSLQPSYPCKVDRFRLIISTKY